MSKLPLFFLLAVITLPLQAQDTASARAFVLKVYADYTNPDERHLQERQDKFYSPQLYRLILADRRGHPGYVGKLDEDPICGCQDAGNLGDLKVQSITFAASNQLRLKATVVLTLFNVGQGPMTTTLSLIRTPLGWRIDDISYKDMPSLRNFLRTK